MIRRGHAWARGLVVGLGGMGIVLAGVVWGPAVTSVGAQTDGAERIQRGAQVFKQTCASCHTIGRDANVAPDLLGVTERREGAWLKVHIKSPSVHHEQNDPISVANRQRFGLAMPTLPLTEDDVEGVIAYLSVAQPEPITVPTPYLPTLGASAVAIIALTLVAFRAATKRVEVRP